MDKKYLNLFVQITQTIAVLAEDVMDLNKKNDDEKGFKTAEIMRNDFQNLHDKISEKDFDPSSLTRADFAKILVGSIIIMQNLEEKVKNIQTAIQGYKIDTIPKLDRVVNEAKTEEEAIELANQLFQIIEETK